MLLRILIPLRDSTVGLASEFHKQQVDSLHLVLVPRSVNSFVLDFIYVVSLCSLQLGLVYTKWQRIPVAAPAVSVMTSPLVLALIAELTTAKM